MYGNLLCYARGKACRCDQTEYKKLICESEQYLTMRQPLPINKPVVMIMKASDRLSEDEKQKERVDDKK